MRAWLLCLLMGCGGGVIQRADQLPTAPPGQAFLEVLVIPKDANIHLGEAFMGQVDGYAQGVLRVPAGTHRITLAKPGYYSHYQVLTVDESGATITVELVPHPGGPPDPATRLPSAGGI